MRTLSLLLVASFVLGTELPDIAVTRYQPVETSIHDLSSALGIRTFGGTFTTNQAFRSVSVDVAFFKNGKRQPAAATSAGLAAAPTEPGHTKGEVSIKVIDLDYLPIKGAPDHAYRIHYSLATEMGVASGFRDIGKDIFDLDRATGSAVLGRGNAQIANPLFYLVGTRSGTVHGAADLNGLLRANENADVMVAHLTFSE